MAVTLLAPEADADALSRASLAVVDEHVPQASCVVRDQGFVNRNERDKSPIGADRWHMSRFKDTYARRRGWLTDARDTNELRSAGLPIMHVNLWRLDMPSRDGAVRRHKRGGVGRKSDIAAVGTNRRLKTREIPLCPIASDTDPFGSTTLPVAHKDVQRVVRVVRHEIAGPGSESYKTPIGAD